MMPTKNAYGVWPASGEIDVMESRGNRNLRDAAGVHTGNEQIGSTVHFGPFWGLNGYPTVLFSQNQINGRGWNEDFHRYQFNWTPAGLEFSVDDILTGFINATQQSFWDRGGFHRDAPGIDNPWSDRSNVSPFDQEFYLIMNVAVGGSQGYFSDALINVPPKPWRDMTERAMTDFWEARAQWLPTWDMQGSNSSMLVDYVRVWAL